MAKVYFVGAGPGSKELLTLKAYELIKRAKVIIYDRLVSEEIRELFPKEALKVCVGEDRFKVLVKYATSYGQVVRLKAGDPAIFSRLWEEVEYLRKFSIDFEIVPGISALQLPQLYGIPITLRGVSSSFLVCTAVREGGEETDFKELTKVQTLIIFMGAKRKEKIARELIEGGREGDERVCFIEKGSRREERVIFSTLKEVSEGKVDISPPALMIVGKVLDYASKSSFYKALAKT